MPSLTTYRTRVRNRMAAHTADTFLTDTKVDEAINTALGQVSLEHDWPWQLTSTSIPTVVGTDTYLVSTSLLRVKSVTLTDLGQPLAQRAHSELDQVISTITGIPQYYAITDQSLEVKPVPSGVTTMKVRYYRTEGTLALVGDTSFFPDPFADLAVEYAAYLLFRATRENDKAADAYAGYKQMVKRAQDNVKRSREPFRVNVRPGSEF